MKIVVISDTHNHHALDLPDADIIIHCGDFTKRGTWHELNQFNSWFSNLPYKIKILVAGNHDNISDLKLYLDPSIIYLENQYFEYNNFIFYGSPAHSARYHWPHHMINVSEYFHHIFNNCKPDIFITHHPPMGILDKVVNGEITGSIDYSVIQHYPELHVFGHIHESRGIHEKNDCTFINASVLDEKYCPINSCFLVTMDDESKKIVKVEEIFS